MTEPSEHWRRLREMHSDDLSEYGFEEIKRRQALRYFTWKWSLKGLVVNDQMRFLLRNTPPSVWRKAARKPNLSDDAWRGPKWSKADRMVYTFGTRLLWHYAQHVSPPELSTLGEPDIGSPFPVDWDGQLISQDLANSKIEAVAIKRLAPDVTSILEVGAGYGRTAYALMHLYPSATYSIVDIEPALSISKWYLTQLFSEQRLQFLTPDATTPNVDLAISISTLQEMTRPQISDYLERFDRHAERVFLKQWTRWSNPDDKIKLRFPEDYGIPEAWKTSFLQRSPVQSRFHQGGWIVPRD